MELFHGNDARSDEVARPLVATLLLLANTFLAGLLIWAARLRETPLFWRNAGGYSEGLRDWIKIGFPVLYSVDFLLVLLAFFVVLRAARVTPRLARLGLCLALIQASLLMFAAGLAVENNLRNIWEGRPLHWHPGDTVE
jgi:hypothetical protein